MLRIFRGLPEDAAVMISVSKEMEAFYNMKRRKLHWLRYETREVPLLVMQREVKGKRRQGRWKITWLQKLGN